MAKRKVLYLVTEDWYFCSHRLPVARAARDAGFEVVVAAREQRHGDAIRAERFQFAPLRLRRRSYSFGDEISSLAEIVRLYKEHRPHIAHHVALKPVIYGSIAARLSGTPAIVNAMAGLGTLFIGGGGLRRIARFAASKALALATPRHACRFLLQNADDRDLMVRIGVATRRQSTVIRGSGVDIARFRPTPEPTTPPLAVLPARMLRDKGVWEFVEAARMLRSRGVNLRCALVGPEDGENPSAIPLGQLQQWNDEGAIEWWGSRTDMPAVYAAAAIVCLPSYREGLPMALLEAAACGRPLVATDVPGCREIVRHGRTGLLVPVRDPAALADALSRLAASPGLRAEFGARARAIAVEEFSDADVAAQTLAVYRSLLLEAGIE